MFEIIPYRSVGPIRFGMTVDDLLATMGNPLKLTKNLLGESDYKYSGFRVVLSSKDKAVVEIVLMPETEAVIDDINVFSSPNTLERLIKKDGNPFEYVGFLIFLNLGLTMTGFHDGDESQKAVTVFAKGRWDHLRPKFKNYIGAKAQA